jgi:hypothetical protein
MHLRKEETSEQEFPAFRRLKIIVKARLEFKLISAKKTTDGHILRLNLKNAGNRILKNIVVRPSYLAQNFSNDSLSCFVYALMPDADETVTFRISVPSLKLIWFSVSGYASGDAYFSLESPLLTVRAKDAEDFILI